MDLSIIMKLLDLFSDVYLIVKFYQVFKFKLRVDHIFRKQEDTKKMFYRKGKPNV